MPEQWFMSKKLTAPTTYVEAVPVSRQKTAFITSTYMQKGDQPILNAPNDAPGSTSENASLNLLNNNIAQNGGDGNGTGANNGSADQDILDNRLQLPELLSDDALVAYSIAQNGGDGNPSQADAQALTARLAELDAEKRAAEGALPGPARDARIEEVRREIRAKPPESCAGAASLTAMSASPSNRTRHCGKRPDAWSRRSFIDCIRK